MDGDPGHTNLLKFSINETNFEHTLVILTVSMTTPWSWQDQLQHWIKVLADHVDKLKISPGMNNNFVLLKSIVFLYDYSLVFS